ncbi:GntR family transcriptional regulator [Allopusillimonas ginsengisoli]|nr:GntR family transcriptional regulator [Allopusillimonas ginsengisoli]
MPTEFDNPPRDHPRCSSPKLKAEDLKVDREEQMYLRLVSAIVSKSLRPGEHVNEMQLASANDLSRPRVRRVLERLEMEGVIEFKLNRGAFISRPSVKEALDVFEARVHLESILFRLACERTNKLDIQRLREHIQSEREAFQKDQSDFNQIAGRFHILVAEIIDNKIILDAIKLLIHRVCLIQSLYETERTVLCLVDEHELLVDLIEARDIEACMVQLVHHCDHIKDSLDLSDQRHRISNIYQAIDDRR